MSTEAPPRARTDGVHRLVDMVVEEVSLVDRAANQHRFLVVKRDETMAKTNAKTKPECPHDPKCEGECPGPDKDAKPKPAKKASGDVLSVATTALETLTTAVERLGEAEDDELVSLAAELAGELEELAGKLADAAGVSAEGDEDETSKSASVGDAVAKVRALLGEVTTLLATAKSAAEADPAPTAAAPAAPVETRVSEQLEAVATSLRTLTDAVKEQGQRLGRLEKGVALPNSRMAPERTDRRADQEIGWPLDLNRPLDRDNVDKSLSFHDR